jgi:hypothetical protein
MKLDEIQNIEVLRSELKKVMCKCIKDVTYKGVNFNQGEYYHYEYSDFYDKLYIFANSDFSIDLVDDIKECFEFCKQL